MTATSSTAATWQAIGTASAANALKSATTTIDVSAATAPTVGQALIATSGSSATWQDNIAPADLTVVQDQRMWRSRLPAFNAGFTLISGTAYWVYIGKTTKTMPLATNGHITFWVSGSGSGAQTAEVAVASTPAAPNRASQTLTVLSAITNANISTLTTTGLKTQTGGAWSNVAAGTHLWIGIRTAMATTQPSTMSLSFDNSQGAILSTAGAAAFAATNTYTGALITAAITAQCPDLQLTLD